MIDRELTQENKAWGNSKYATDFDYLMHDYVLKTLRPLFLGKECAELGCYKGEMTRKLSKEFSSVTAIDIEEKYCDIIKGMGLQNVSVVQSDFSKYQNYNQFSDLLSLHSLEHVEDDLGLLRHIQTHKSSDTRLHIVVPNGTSLSRQIAVNMGFMSEPLAVTEFEEAIGHHRTYNLELLKDLASRAGLKVIKAGGIMPKIFSNSQYDKALQEGIIDRAYLDAAYALSDEIPELCSSIYITCN
ncbi:hypothetical protein WH95_11820 [Kiloniella litopenaei]|uniref:Methyltransferase domain-containing protein n=1 Tax=Kiloniella litopenaei TaxID=1549748 RepID=A0A0M2R4A0_9PROT|nr:class I SAM-dependent methyltransferase [Kiloniella litopenaei]KKJ76501.1 hypothetical protein WH95_11820 [Kiloniella litopenaei]